MVRDNNILIVADLIDNANREWRRDIITDTFFDADVARIFQIPLAKEPHEDVIVEHSRSGWGVVAKNALGKVVTSRSMIHANAIATKSLKNGEEFYLEVTILRFIVRITEEEWIREPGRGGRC
ncbi:hypothetical protein Goari_004170 [Gossypium aridum]|uniref:Uncharacterized protein n=1 Tax=Gossypium aridum TaxID=34290 RepID=A0A7J8Y2M2_GOSAI|nr:hypothetical protein [Gossypium aridum]